MGKWKYIGGLIAVVILVGVIWLERPVKDKVEELESQLNSNYLHARSILSHTINKLVEWDFSQPLTAENEDAFFDISYEFQNITDLFFDGTVHYEWRIRIVDAQIYLNNYKYETIISEEDIADLYQILQGTRFILRDFYDYQSNGNYYEAMHSKKHEMFDRVKMRLAMEY